MVRPVRPSLAGGKERNALQYRAYGSEQSPPHGLKLSTFASTCCKDLKVQLEQACCILQAKDKEVSELKAIVEKLNGQNSKFEEKAGPVSGSRFCNRVLDAKGFGALRPKNVQSSR